MQARGNTVIVGGRRQELLDRIADEHPGIGTVRIDTTSVASIDAAARAVLTARPDLNALIAMSGISRVEDWHQPESFLESAEAVITTNLLGPIRRLGAFIEDLRTRPQATIVTVSSGLAFAPLAATPSYNASKAAIHMLTESVRFQTGRHQHRVPETGAALGTYRPASGTGGKRLGDAARGVRL